MQALDVDEMIAQLLASEGFTSLEEVAYVEVSEIADIEGFDDETAVELQTRAQEYLDRKAREFDDKRKELGVDDALTQIENVTGEMLVRFGENDIKNLEDLAYCATDDLTGWVERKDGESVRFEGILDGIGITAAEAEAMIMQARLAAGIITEEDLAPPAEEGEEDAATDEQEEQEASETPNPA